MVTFNMVKHEALANTETITLIIIIVRKSLATVNLSFMVNIWLTSV